MRTPTFRVYAWWNQSVWQYSYVEPCPACRRRHMHGGGTGEQPDLAIGQAGWWVTHCRKSDGQVKLRLAYIVQKGGRP